MRTKKMRLLSFVLALAMMLAIAPVGAFADGTYTDITTLKIKDGKPDTDGMTSSVGTDGATYYTGYEGGSSAVAWQWKIDVKKNEVLNLCSGYRYTGAGTQEITCGLNIYDGAAVSGGRYSVNWISLGGIITGGTFLANCAAASQTSEHIKGGIFKNNFGIAGTRVLSAADCTINDIIKTGKAYILGENQEVTVTTSAVHFLKWKVNGVELENSILSNATTTEDATADTISITFVMPNIDVTIDVEREKTPLKLDDDGMPVDKDGKFWAGSPSDGWEFDKTNKKLSIYDGYTVDLRGYTIDWTITNEGTLIGDTFTKGVTNKGTIESGTFAGSFNNSGANAVVKSGVFTHHANFGAQNPSTTWVNVKNGTLNGVLTGMARIVGEQEVTVKPNFSENLFQGWTYSGNISSAVAEQLEKQKNSYEMTLTLDGDAEDSINLMPKTNGEAFDLTLLDGKATVDGKTVTAAAPGETVTLSIDDSEIPEGMSFDHWVISPEVEPDEGYKLTDRTMNFKMPAQELTIYASLRTDSDDGMDAMTVVAGVAIGAGAAVLTYHIGTELYAEQVLGKGVAVPKTREDVALKAWELAGKPAVAVEGEPLSEAAQAEKWAIESGLMQNVDGSFNGQKKMNKLKALRVLDSAKKMGAQ